MVNIGIYLTQPKNKPTQDRVASQALKMASGTMLSRILGLVRDQAFAAMFPRTITDAWAVAFRLPNLFRRLLGEGSLSVSFIPVFIEAEAESPERAKNLVNSFYTLLLLVLGTVTLLGVIFSPQLIALLTDANYALIPGKLELTIRFSQIMFSFVFLICTYAFFMGILNALGSFALPAMAPTLFNVAMIAANYSPKEWQVVHGDALAWGVVIGGLLQMLVLVPSLRKKGYFPSLSLNVFNKDAISVWRRMGPGLLGMSVLQGATLINTQFATGLGEGSVTYIYLADRLLELPLSLISVSIGTALLPLLSRHRAQNDNLEFQAAVVKYLKLNLFLGALCAAGLFGLGLPIVKLLFGYGHFTDADAIATAQIVQIYALTLILSSTSRVMTPAFYAIKDTVTPALLSVVTLVLHVLMAPVLMQEFGLNGLVLSTLASSFLNILTLSFIYQQKIAKWPLAILGSFLAKIFLSASAVVMFLLSYKPVFAFLQKQLTFELSAFLLNLICLTAYGALAVAIYLRVSSWLNVEEAQFFIAQLKKRF